MRVHELAKTRGVSSRQVLEVLAAASMPATTASSRLTSEQVETAVRALGGGTRRSTSSSSPAPPVHAADPEERHVATPSEQVGAALAGLHTQGPASGTPSSEESLAPPSSSGSSPSNDSEHLRQFIRQAYDAARHGGKEDWRYMSVAVLKNRISQLLGEKFDQRKYGYPRILDLVLAFPDLLAVDQESQPPVAVLLAEAEPPDVDENVQVRPDLWRAVIDYERGEPYLLVQGTAVPSSAAPDSAATSTPLPTITPAELDKWRRDFAQANMNLLEGNPDSLERLSKWVDEGLGTKALPGVLQGRWNLYLKRAVLQRLRQWFIEHELPIPGDLLVGSSRPAKRPELAQRVTEESRLRLVLIECLSKMTYEELRQVTLPAISLLRLRR